MTDKELFGNSEQLNDTISRQAAIDALDVLCQEHRYKIPGKGETYSQYSEAWQDALDRAEGAIFNLPSAQPEIIRCKDCRFATLTYDGDCKYCQYLEGEFGLTDAVYFDGNDYCSHAERRTDG